MRRDSGKAGRIGKGTSRKLPVVCRSMLREKVGQKRWEEYYSGLFRTGSQPELRAIVMHVDMRRAQGADRSAAEWELWRATVDAWRRQHGGGNVGGAEASARVLAFTPKMRAMTIQASRRRLMLHLEFRASPSSAGRGAEGLCRREEEPAQLVGLYRSH